jgi:aminoglycoside phosphotransferase (APT) family kinase protein
MFLDPAFERQFRLLQLIARNGWVRVPRAMWQEEDSNILGRPFFIMERIVGRVPVSFPNYNTSGWLVDASPRERERAWLSAMDQFAAIHRIPTKEVGFLLRPEYGATGPEDEFQYWLRTLDWVTGERTPAILTQTAEWLARHKPAQPLEGLSWGDARIGNMMFDADFQVAAVLDWEQASLAGGLQDLAWWLLLDDVASVHRGTKRLEGLGNRQQTIDLWRELTGLGIDDLDWYEAFAMFKLLILSIRGDHLRGKPTSDNFLAPLLGERLGLSAKAL